MCRLLNSTFRRTDPTMAESELDDEKAPMTPFMVTIRSGIFDDLSVFPPINHEGLHISPHSQSTTHYQPPKSPDSSPSSYLCNSSSFSSTSISVDSDESDVFGESLTPPDSNKECRCRLASALRTTVWINARTYTSSFGWLGFGLEILRRRIRNSVSSIFCFGALAAAVRSSPVMSTVAVVYMASLVLKWIRLRRRRHSKVEMLVGKIMEQDEKIGKLMDQIAHLNQVLPGHQISH